MIAASVAALAGCSNDYTDCSGGDYRGGCMAGPPRSMAAQPAVAPAAAGVSRGGVLPAGVSLGDPRDFADIDDKQCRSYGLAFGSHDYAECRIRLSAQHRGLDPNIGAPGSR